MYGYGYSYPNNPQGSGLMGNLEARVNADGGIIASPALSSAFLNAVYSQSLQSSIVISALPAYKTTGALIDKWYDINGNDGIGTTTFRPSLLGFSANFDGTDDFVEVPHNANQLLTGGGCFMAWVNADAITTSTSILSANRIIDKSTASNATAGWMFGLYDTNKIGFRINAGATAASTGTVSTGVWTHVSVVFTDAGVSTFYINGASAGGGATALASGITTTNALKFANRSNATDRPFDGLIAIPSVFSSQLTDTQILSIFNQTAPFFA